MMKCYIVSVSCHSALYQIVSSYIILNNENECSPYIINHTINPYIIAIGKEIKINPRNMYITLYIYIYTYKLPSILYTYDMVPTHLISHLPSPISHLGPPRSVPPGVAPASPGPETWGRQMKIPGKPWEKHRKNGEIWEIHGKNMEKHGKLWGKYGKI